MTPTKTTTDTNNQIGLEIYHHDKSIQICSSSNMISFSRNRKGDKQKVIGFCDFQLTSKMIELCESSKIILFDMNELEVSRNKDYSSFQLEPLFGFSYEKLEDIFQDLFEKYNMV